MEPPNFITMFTTRHLCLSKARQSTPFHNLSLKFILILSSHLHLPNCILLRVSPPKLCMHFASRRQRHTLPPTHPLWCYHPNIPFTHYNLHNKLSKLIYVNFKQHFIRYTSKQAHQGRSHLPHIFTYSATCAVQIPTSIYNQRQRKVGLPTAWRQWLGNGRNYDEVIKTALGDNEAWQRQWQQWDRQLACRWTQFVCKYNNLILLIRSVPFILSPSRVSLSVYRDTIKDTLRDWCTNAVVANTAMNSIYFIYTN
jgi:hypothetical protein